MSSPVIRSVAVACLTLFVPAQQSYAWGVDGHHLINRTAVEALPSDTPSFLRSPFAADAMEYYAPLPDHWRSPAVPELTAASAPEHFIQLETVDAYLPEIPRNRFDYVRALATIQPTHPDQVLTAEHLGMQPYQANEVYERLTIGMRDYRQLLAQKGDTKAVEAEIVFLAGWLGHYVGDGSMPLHTSKYPNGWTGPNPNHYNDGHNIHALFESEYVHNNVKASDIAPLVPSKAVFIEDVFAQYDRYLHTSNTHVEEVYQLDQQGAFTGAGSSAGKALVDRQLAAAATELRDLIYTAWVRSAEPLPERIAPKL